MSTYFIPKYTLQSRECTQICTAMKTVNASWQSILDRLSTDAFHLTGLITRKSQYEQRNQAWYTDTVGSNQLKATAGRRSAADVKNRYHVATVTGSES